MDSVKAFREMITDDIFLIFAPNIDCWLLLALFWLRNIDCGNSSEAEIDCGNSMLET